MENEFIFFLLNLCKLSKQLLLLWYLLILNHFELIIIMLNLCFSGRPNFFAMNLIIFEWLMCQQFGRLLVIQTAISGAILTKSLSNFIHKRYQNLDRKYFETILGINVLYKQPILLVQGLRIGLDKALIDPEISWLDKAFEKYFAHLFAFFRFFLQ